MVEIIKESNPEINKNLFLKKLATLKEGVKLEVVKVSEAKKSKRNKNEEFIYIDFLINGEFKGALKLNKDGSISHELIDASNDIISLPFTLSELNENGNYTISRNKNLFNILNYGMIEKEMIPANNKNSVICNYEEIKTALTDLKFNATSKLISSRDFQDYYRLEVMNN